MNPASIQTSIRRAAMAALVLPVAWIGLVTLFAAQLVFLGQRDWQEAFNAAIPFWIPWGLLSPLVVWMGFKLPITRGHFWRNLVFHIVACAAVIYCCQELTRLIAGQQGRPGPGAGPRGGPPFSMNDDGRPRGPMFRGPPAGRGPMGRANPLRANFDLMLYAGITSICHAIGFFRTSKQRERQALELESRLAVARLNALRMQLNPHFLFNTLNAISTLVHTDPNAADEMIGDLSELLRVSLVTGNEQEVSLRRELEFLQHYLAIEKRRFGARLTVEEDIPSDTLDCAVPTLILQPLVENAVKHGIEKRRAPGRIRIQSRREGDKLQLVINDRVENIAAGGTVATPGEDSAGHGIGLRNTRERLQELYGMNHRFEVQQEDGRGFTVEITIPIRDSATMKPRNET